MIHANHEKLRQWRVQVGHAAMAEMAHMRAKGGAGWPAPGPVGLVVTFNFQRPAGHHVNRKLTNPLRVVAPREHYVKPDLDKLVRAIGDALTDVGVIVDDSQITVLRASKRWTTEEPYATVQVEVAR
jgi:Holliday junction resolvase RusA-like endonuclease